MFLKIDGFGGAVKGLQKDFFFALGRQLQLRTRLPSGKPTVVGCSRRDLEFCAEVNARSLAAAGARPGMMLRNASGYGLFTGVTPDYQLEVTRLGSTRWN